MDVALDHAVKACQKKLAENGKAEEVILLSPACASFDQFPNFMKRGDIFREAVQHFLETGSVAVDPEHMVRAQTGN